MEEEQKKLLREMQRREFECEETPVVLPEEFCDDLDDKRLSTRVDPCDPVEECRPPKLLKPAAKPIVIRPVLLLPDPLILSNELVTVYCTAPKTGEAASIEAGQITSDFDWRSIPNIRADQLDLIAKTTNIDSVRTLDPVTVASITKLNPVQVAYFIEAVTEELAALQTAAETAAIQSLICWYDNAEVTVNCESNALPSSLGDIAVVFSVTIPTGTYRSFTSQSEADNLADAAALAALTCVYGNDEIVRTCTALDFGLDVSPAGTTSVTIPENSFFSGESKEVANELAVLSALSSLDCFYGNEELVLVCPNTDSESRVVGTSTVTAEFNFIGDADITTSRAGSRVVVPAGYVKSLVSVELAQIEAAVIANSLLLCSWVNQELTISCPPSAQSPQTLTAPAGTFISQFSAGEILDQLENFVLFSLRCIFCNVAVPALCDTGSLDATIGIAAGVICSESAEDAQSIAQELANIPKKNGPSEGVCAYGNDEQSVTCADKVVSVTGLSSQSVNLVIIPANSYVVTNSDPVAGKIAANALARTAAIAGLYCFFENPVGTFHCGPGLTTTGAYYTGGGVTSGDFPYDFSVNSIGSTSQPVITQAGMFTSTVSAAEVNAQLVAYVTSIKDCFYDSALVTMRCGLLRGAMITAHDDDEPLGTGVMPYDTDTPVDVSAEGSTDNPVIIKAQANQSYISTKDATLASVQQAYGGLDCWIENDERNFFCGDDYTDKTSAGLVVPSNISLFSNPLVFPAGYLRSYKSQVDLDNQIVIAAKASIVCLYGNLEVAVPPCADGLISLGPASLPANVIISEIDQESATATAAAIALGLSICLDPDDIGGGDGSPGNDGPQTNCEGECFGFYS